MKLTREKVSQLSDVELNRGMAWCYPPKHNITYTDQSGVLKYYTERKWQLEPINYLTDCNLTMPLFIESRLWLQPSQSTANGWFSYDDSNCSSVMVDNPLRAITEVLVMIAMERDSG